MKFLKIIVQLLNLLLLSLNQLSVELLASGSIVALDRFALAVEVVVLDSSFDLAFLLGKF